MIDYVTYDRTTGRVIQFGHCNPAVLHLCVTGDDQVAVEREDGGEGRPADVDPSTLPSA